MSRHALRRLARLEGRLPRETCEALLRTVSDAELDELIRRLKEVVPPDARTPAGPGATERGMTERDEAATLAWMKAVLAEIRQEKGDE
jgi:hypothetical protein